MKWDEDISKVDLQLGQEVHDSMLEVIKVKNTLKPHPRTWIPSCNVLKTLVIPFDGSISGYSIASAFMHAPKIRKL